MSYISRGDGFGPVRRRIARWHTVVSAATEISSGHPSVTKRANQPPLGEFGGSGQQSVALRIILKHRGYLMPRHPISAFQEVQFDDEREPGHSSAQSFH